MSNLQILCFFEKAICFPLAWWRGRVTTLLSLEFLVLQVNLCVFPLLRIVPMLEETEGLGQGQAIGFVDGAAGGVGESGCFAQVFIAVVEAAELGPLTDDDVHGDGIAGHLVLRDDERAGPIAIEGGLHPLGIGGSVHVARAVSAIDEEEEGLLAQVFVGHEVHEGLVAGLAVALVLTDVVVGILPPEQADVRGAIPVLGRQSHARAVVGLQKGGVDEVVGIDDALGQSSRHLAVVG